MPRQGNRHNSLDRRIVKRVEERAYKTVHESALNSLYSPYFDEELSQRLVLGTSAEATGSTVSFHACRQRVGSVVNSKEFDESIEFRSEIGSHRLDAEKYNHWIVVSECGALEAARHAMNDITADSKLVLSSEVAGSQSLHTRRIDVVCGFSDELIGINETQMCACSMLIAKRGFLKQAAKRHCHECLPREELARAAAARLILNLPHFPFTSLVDPKSKVVIGPVHVITAFSFLQYDAVLPLIPNTREDITFWKRNGCLLVKLLTVASQALRSSNTRHMSRPVVALVRPPSHAEQKSADAVLAASSLNACSFDGRCNMIVI